MVKPLSLEPREQSSWIQRITVHEIFKNNENKNGKRSKQKEAIKNELADIKKNYISLLGMKNIIFEIKVSVGGLNSVLAQPKEELGISEWESDCMCQEELGGCCGYSR